MEGQLLPEQNGFKIISTKPSNCQLLKVSELINRSNTTWDKDILNSLFLPFEVDQIIRIPLINTTKEDYLTWAYTTDGNYDVNSGYHAINHWYEQQTNPTGSSTNDQDTI